ncbi:hypothetical protein [Cupriavidus basilensis]|uniref:hypothetical protein n=1 Tax=Cupriavidus basilensis TaxID=68895 RepID=UPI000682B5AA|nr:hypothetical protein [Cupriavidus basilensis]
MKLTADERQVLITASQLSHDVVQEAIHKIRAEHPDAFHSGDSLASRVFFDQPVRDEPCKGFIRFIAVDRLADTMGSRSSCPPRA